MSAAAANLLLFGVTGDLSRRMLMPSLFGLDADGLLPPDLAIWGTARSDITDDTLRQIAAIRDGWSGATANSACTTVEVVSFHESSNARSSPCLLPKWA